MDLKGTTPFQRLRVYRDRATTRSYLLTGTSMIAKQHLNSRQHLPLSTRVIALYDLNQWCSLEEKHPKGLNSPTFVSSGPDEAFCLIAST